MVQHDDTRAYKGRGVLFIRRVFLYVLVTAPILSFCLMGAKWWHIFLAMLALALPCVTLVGVLVALFDTFSFDEEHQQIVRPLRRAIPYARVLRIDLNITGRLLQVSLPTRLLWRKSLVHSLDVADKPGLSAELHRRFPRAVIQERTFGDWKALFAVTAVMVLLTVIFHLSVYRGSFANVPVPQRVEWTVERPGKGMQKYRVGTFQIAMPKSYQCIAKGSDALLFEDGALKTEFQFVAAPERKSPPSRYAIMQYATGIVDYFDVLETAYFARIGVIPLALKEAALTGLSDVNLLAIQQTAGENNSNAGRKADNAASVKSVLQSGLRGFAAQGKKKGKEITMVFLKDSTHRAEMHVFISGPVRLDQNKLQSIVANIN